MKKRIMRMISMLMVLVMTLGMCVTGYADDDTYTITVKNSIGDVEYNVYKVFDVSYSEDKASYSYTIDSSSEWYTLMTEETVTDDEGNVVPCPFEFTAVSGSDSLFYVSLKDEMDEAEVAAWFNALSDSQYPEGSKVNSDDLFGNGGDLVIELDDAGYYVVVPSSDYYDPVAVSVTTTDPNATIVDKNQKPGEGGEVGLEKDSDSTSYSVGDTATYIITAYVPTYDGKNEVDTYIIKDTMSDGLTYGSISSIMLSGTSEEGKVSLDIKDLCTIDDTSENGVITITWRPSEIEEVENYTYPADAVITITYTATVNEAADDVNLHNDVELDWYYNEPDPEDPEEPDGKTETDEDVYTYGFDLKKVDGTDDANVLEGAQFTLQKEGSSDLISFIYDETSDTYEEWDGDEETKDDTTSTIIATDGEINIWGLGAGTYTLTEIVAPDGYNILTDPVSIVIAVAENGWIVTVDSTTTSVGAFTSETEATDSHGVAVMPTVTVVNNAGSTLPGTGGIGTTIFYVVGTLLVLAGAALVVAKMRLGKTE